MKWFWLSLMLSVPTGGEGDRANATELAELLANKYAGEERASELDLRVNSQMPKNMMCLMQLYPQPVRRHRSVEYVPLPYHAKSACRVGSMIRIAVIPRRSCFG